MILLKYVSRRKKVSLLRVQRLEPGFRRSLVHVRLTILRHHGEVLLLQLHVLLLTREEDITKAAWVAKSSLPPFLKNTFPSIVEVFREARI